MASTCHNESPTRARPPPGYCPRLAPIANPPSYHHTHAPHGCSSCFPQPSHCADAHQFSQQEVDLRVRIATLENELKDRERQKAGLETATLFLAQFTASRTSAVGNGNVATQEIYELKSKINNLNQDNSTLRAQLGQTNSIVLQLISRLGQKVAPRKVTKASFESENGTLIDLVDNQPSSSEEESESEAKKNAVFDEQSSEEGQVTEDSEPEYPSLSSSFIGVEKPSLPYITRFTKAKGVASLPVTPVLTKVW